jgi:hypothetical protein
MASYADSVWSWFGSLSDVRDRQSVLSIDDADWVAVLHKLLRLQLQGGDSDCVGIFEHQWLRREILTAMIERSSSQPDSRRSCASLHAQVREITAAASRELAETAGLSKQEKRRREVMEQVAQRRAAMATSRSSDLIDILLLWSDRAVLLSRAGLSSVDKFKDIMSTLSSNQFLSAPPAAGAGAMGRPIATSTVRAVHEPIGLLAPAFAETEWFAKQE